jgi:hypothetical protein
VIGRRSRRLGLTFLSLLVVVVVEAWALVVLADTGRMCLLKTLVAAHPQSLH